MLNPFVLGAIRERQIQEAFRRNAIRMDLAGNTGFLNPELYTAYLSGQVPPLVSEQQAGYLSSLYQVPAPQTAAIPPEFFINPVLPLPAVTDQTLITRQLLAELAERKLRGEF